MKYRYCKSCDMKRNKVVSLIQLHPLMVFLSLLGIATLLADRAQGQDLSDRQVKDSLMQRLEEEHVARFQARLHEQALLNERSFSSPATAVLEQDSLALVALYNSTNGPNWRVNNNWLVNPVSSWSGIALRGNRVSRIS